MCWLTHLLYVPTHKMQQTHSCCHTHILECAHTHTQVPNKSSYCALCHIPLSSLHILSRGTSQCFVWYCHLDTKQHLSKHPCPPYDFIHSHLLHTSIYYSGLAQLHLHNACYLGTSQHEWIQASSDFPTTRLCLVAEKKLILFQQGTVDWW